MASGNKRIGMGLVGPGFIAQHHIDAVRRLNFVDLIGLAGSSQASAAKAAQSFGVPHAFGTYEELIADPRIDVVHNTTPNYLHHPVSLAALRAGKHVVSDKPLALNSAECSELAEAARQAGVVNAVTFNYRGNPLVQEARARIRNGDLGELSFIHGQYLQDWMADDRVYSWRSDPAKGGASSALADIGSHWCDLAEYMSGAKIVSVLAEVTTVIGTRYTTGASAKAFETVSNAELHPVTVTGEDLATVLLRFSNGARGSMTVGQVMPGHKNDLQIEINGRKASLRWLQERQNELWIGHDKRANEVLAKDPSLLTPEARAYAHLPGGHQESWADAFRNIIADIYAAVEIAVQSRDEPKIQASADSSTQRSSTVCTFADAAHTVAVIEAMLASAAAGGVWQMVEQVQ
ncbi:MAG: Gfo/Idh/MocA family protein [Janthinobacterium lividum]